MLDAGCGTANYAKALIDLGIRRISLVDASSDMLAVASDKLKNVTRRNVVGDVIQTKFPPFPFPDNTFDAIMFNQVGSTSIAQITLHFLPLHCLLCRRIPAFGTDLDITI